MLAINVFPLTAELINQHLKKVIKGSIVAASISKYGFELEPNFWGSLEHIII